MSTFFYNFIHSILKISTYSILHVKLPVSEVLMSHKTILLAVFCFVFLTLFFYIIKNKPDYLVLLGIRSLFSYVLIQFVNYLCTVAHLSVLDRKSVV